MFTPCLCELSPGAFLPQSKGKQLVGLRYSKLPIGVNVGVSECKCLPVSLCWPVKSVPCLSPYDSWDRLQPLRDPAKDKQGRGGAALPWN